WHFRGGNTSLRRSGIPLILICIVALVAVLITTATSGQKSKGECEENCTRTYQECQKETNANQADCKRAFDTCLAGCKNVEPSPSPTPSPGGTPGATPSPTPDTTPTATPSPTRKRMP